MTQHQRPGVSDSDEIARFLAERGATQCPPAMCTETTVDLPADAKAFHAKRPPVLSDYSQWRKNKPGKTVDLHKQAPKPVLVAPEPEPPAEPTPTPEIVEQEITMPVEQPDVLAPVITRSEMGSIKSAGQQLRTILFDELRDLRSGESNPQRAQAVAKLAGQIVATVRMEVEASRLRDGLDVRLPVIGPG